MRKHYVTFLSPGTFVDEESTKEISSWDIPAAVKMAANITERHGAKPYGFRFSTAIITDDVPDGEGGTLKVMPKTVDTSGIHFLGGWLETLYQVEARADPKEDMLRSNMRCNGMFVVCFNTNSYKSCHPFGEKDILLGFRGAVAERGDSTRLVEYRKSMEKAKATPS